MGARHHRPDGSPRLCLSRTANPSGFRRGCQTELPMTDLKQPIQLGASAMSVSDILVYVDPTASSSERLDIALRLAHRFEAYLIGVVPEDAAMVGEKFQKMLLNESLLGEWHMAIGLTELFVTRWAHCADLVILGQRIPDTDTGLYHPEDV